MKIHADMNKTIAEGTAFIPISGDEPRIGAD